jgi:hypothetical protein
MLLLLLLLMAALSSNLLAADVHTLLAVFGIFAASLLLYELLTVTFLICWVSYPT